MVKISPIPIDDSLHVVDRDHGKRSLSGRKGFLVERCMLIDGETTVLQRRRICQLARIRLAFAGAGYERRPAWRSDRLFEFRPRSL